MSVGGAGRGDIECVDSPARARAREEVDSSTRELTASDALSGGARETSRRAVTLARVARAIAVAPIVLYQRVISPALPRRCKYEPTCSHYAIGAIRRYGPARGVVLAVWRLLRCNPFSYGGYDPVESQRLFKVHGEPGGLKS
jgi:putative membrane protein insertion efficiency factor